MMLNDIINKNDFFIKQFCKSVKRNCSIKETIKMNKKWKKDYKKQGYKFMSREDIYDTVVSILSKKI
jgi:hypothetical protein